MTKPHNPERRKALKKIVTGGAALAAGAAFVGHEGSMRAEEVTSPDPWWQAHTDWSRLSNLKKKLTTATIKGIDFSRMIMGSNLINGWSHSRDLIYVSEAMREYHTREKVFAMFQLGEACGINAYSGSPENIELLTDYWKSTGGKMRFIVQSRRLEEALDCIEKGATTAYLHGGVCDTLTREGKFDEIIAYVEGMRKAGALV